MASGQGARTVENAVALLLDQAEDAADRHGDPEGILDAVPDMRRRSRIASSVKHGNGRTGVRGHNGNGRTDVHVYEGVGRNDPCPCGSCRKFKKCHGGARSPQPPEPAAGSAWPVDNPPAAGSRSPQLVTDGTPRPEPADEVPPELAGPVIRQFLDRHYATWPDEPVPALGGRTPRDAVRDPAGRSGVIELLRSFEAAERTRPEQLRYDLGWLWEDLGLLEDPES